MLSAARYVVGDPSLRRSAIPGARLSVPLSKRPTGWLRSALAPTALAGAIVALHASGSAWGGALLARLAFRPLDWARRLADSGAAPPSWDTALGYALAHVDWAHVLFNATASIGLGAVVVRAVGVARWAFICIVGALAGAFGEAAPMALSSRFEAETALVGASAVVAALAGVVVWLAAAGAAADPRERRRAEIAALAGAAAAFAFLLVAPTGGAADVPMSWRAHVAGFLVGFGLARPLVRGRSDWPWGDASGGGAR